MRRFAIVGAVLALAPVAATTRDLPAQGLTMEEVVSWLQARGYTASIKYDTILKGNYVLDIAKAY